MDSHSPTHCSYCKECPNKFITFDCNHNFCVDCLQEIFETCYQEDNPLCMVCLLCGESTYVEANVIEVLQSIQRSKSKLNKTSFDSQIDSPEVKAKNDQKYRTVNSISLDFNPKIKDNERKKYIKCSEIIKNYNSNDGSSSRNQLNKTEILKEVSNLFRKPKQKSSKNINKLLCCQSDNAEPAVWCLNCRQNKCNYCFKECLEMDHEMKEVSHNTDDYDNKQKEVLIETEIALKLITEARHLCKANIECVEESYSLSRKNLESKYKELLQLIQEKFESLLQESNDAKQAVLINLYNDYEQMESFKKNLEINYNLLNQDNSYSNEERKERLDSNIEILTMMRNLSFDEYIRESKSFTCTTNTSSLFNHLATLNQIQLEVSTLSGVDYKRMFRKSYLSDNRGKAINKSLDFTFRSKLSTRREDYISNQKARNSKSISRSFISDFAKRANTETGLDELSTTLKDKSKLFSERYFNTKESKTGNKQKNGRQGISHLIESLKKQSESFRKKSRADRFNFKENNQFLN